MDSKKTPRQKKEVKDTKVVKKPTSRTMTSKRTTTKKTSNFSIYIIFAMLIIITILCGYIYLLKTTQTTISSNATINETLSNATLGNTTTEENRTYSNITIGNVTTQENITSNETITPSKPYLVIIIDDVVSKAQMDRINRIPLKITPSFLPSTSKTPYSAKNTKFANFHMVHLPLEALNFSDEQDKNRLYVRDSYEDIYLKLAKFKQEFPDTIFYNGHTGSRFTSNYEAMDRLFQAMEELGLIYVESRTIGNIASEKIAKKYNKKLLVRDIFLDHEVTEKFITQQLNLAIQTAKQKGFAIAIGHPHKETLDILEGFSNSISREVEVVYLKDLYYAKN